MKVVPFLDFRWPCISGNTQRCDHQNLADEETVEAEIENGGQRDDAFAETHVQEHSRHRVVEYEVSGVSLVIMRFVFH